MTAPAVDSAAQEAEEVLFRPFPGFQSRALSVSGDEVFIGGAKGASKSSVIVAKPLYQIHKPRYKALVLRHSFPELQEIMDRMQALYMKLPASQRPAWNGDKERYEFPSGAKVRVGFAHKRIHVQRYQGQEWADILYDEMGNLADEGVIDALLAEQRCPDPTVRRQLIGSGNPGYAGHGWIKRRFIIPCGRDGAKTHWVTVRMPDGSEHPISRQFVPGRVTDNPVYANDPKYMATLLSLPDRLRRCLLDGDWDAATGMAFDELEPSVHLVPQFACPDHWPYIAAFDWGFAHWAVFVWGRVSDDGRIYICDTIKMRRMADWDICGTITERVPPAALKAVQAGHDMWGTGDGKGDQTPTRAAYFYAQGINVVQANIKRAMGYANMLQYMAWRETPYLPQRQPMVQWMDTPGNRHAVEEHLASMIVDPDDPSVILKVDADQDTGAGGDDITDATRYLLSSRPMKAPSMKHLLKLSAWDDHVLRREAEKVYRPDLTANQQPRPLQGVYLGV